MFDFIKWLIGTSVFGAVVGFILGRWGAASADKHKEESFGHQLLRNLYQEVGSNRFKIQALLAGEDALYLETFSWDAVRVNRAFLIFDKDKAVHDKLHYLYLSIQRVNLRVAGVLTSLDSMLRNPANPGAKEMSDLATKILKEYAQATLLPRLIEMETALRLFLEKEKIIKHE